MFPRKIVVLLLCVFGYVVLQNAIIQKAIITSIRKPLAAIISYQAQNVIQVSSKTSSLSHDSAAQMLERMFPYNVSSRPNPNIAMATTCQHLLNQHTQHYRLPKARLSRFHMTSPNDSSVARSYFNPTILTLPSWSKYDYVVFSRLVTPGLHQETHFCPATVDLTTRDIRCSLSPRALNIPPTAAYRCTGPWASFADIPGFHDPRVFWSGKGEPLIIVNSASSATPNGCVGLWLVDLRVIIPELAGWMMHKVMNKEMLEDNREDGQHETHGQTRLAVQPKMSYPYLTEITKNPRSSRNPVEKNWALFFPKGEESWVMYDMVVYERTEQYRTKEVLEADAVKPTNVTVGGARSGNTTSHGSDLDFINRENTTLDQSTNLTQIQSHNASVDLNKLRGYPTSSLQPRQAISARLTSDQVDLKPSRSLAKLIGAGLTTTNLTSPHEPSCFSNEDVRDSLNETGFWHQGSNSLRLVLCQGEQHATGNNQQSATDDCLLTPENEAELVQQGKVVHFMVMHRKFSNGLKLPLRYERYVLFWEARWPFHILGLSKHPILFSGERARPWTIEENWPAGEFDDTSEAHIRSEKGKWNGAYFSYTPSLAWSGMLRRPDETFMDLGTGYLGDEVIIGVGLDDDRQGFVRVKVDDVLNCLRICPYFDQSA